MIDQLKKEIVGMLNYHYTKDDIIALYVESLTLTQIREIQKMDEDIRSDQDQE